MRRVRNFQDFVDVLSKIWVRYLIFFFFFSQDAALCTDVFPSGKSILSRSGVILEWWDSRIVGFWDFGALGFWDCEILGLWKSRIL